MTVDAIADHHNFSAPKSKFSGSVRDGYIETDNGRVKALILKPMTFMNESGRSVGAAAQFYKIPKDKIAVFHDELDLDAGKFRMKLGGGIAGHNGLRSIKAQMGGRVLARPHGHRPSGPQGASALTCAVRLCQV